MTLLTRPALLAAIILIGAAAAPASAQEQVTPGTWRFLERLGGTPSVILEGTFGIDPDTIWVDADWAECQRAEATTRTRLVYECDRVTISFDRFDPLRRVSYNAPVTVLERVEKCEQYQTNAAGQQVCVRWRRETVEREVWKTGRITPKRDVPPGAPPAG